MTGNIDFLSNLNFHFIVHFLFPVAKTIFLFWLNDLSVKNQIRFNKSKLNSVYYEFLLPFPSRNRLLLPFPSIYDIFSAKLPRSTPLIRENTMKSLIVFWLTNSVLGLVELIIVKMLMARMKELLVVTRCRRLRWYFSENKLKHVVSFRRPCSSTTISMKSLFQMVLVSLKQNEDCELLPF